MSDKKVLYIIVCAAGPAGDVWKLVDMAHERGWTVQLISTPAALAFIDTNALEKQTGRPVRSAHRAPGSPRSPKADALIIAPATFNTINKLATGISDNYALDIASELSGTQLPIVILPYINRNYFSRTPLQNSIHALKEEGIYIQINESTPHPQGKGDPNSFPWSTALEIIMRVS
ncbi:flavoprotein [Streptomonospora sp. PA3]|uniref:flavoprotein n=1 Tax=Streptomonospora sp. PA3 TaxID=2607326 RepID=UPI0012DD6730|nr:flavoprotein [Streptomonospora sp. PA3]MUL43093.1 flavoprotein [Streptomonospora sp. PA3]